MLEESLGVGCFETGSKLHQVGIHTGPAILTQVQQDRTTQLPIINMTDKDVTIKAGTDLGTITSLEEDTAYIASLIHKDPGADHLAKEEGEVHPELHLQSKGQSR